MIRVSLRRGNSHEGVGLHLPATPADMGQAFARLDSITTTGKTVLRGLTPENAVLQSHFEQADWDDPTQVGQLNSLAEKLENMTQGEKTIFYSLLSGCPQAKPEELLNIAEQVPDYQLMKLIQTLEDLGEYMVAKGYLEFPDSAKPYLHYGRIGREQHMMLKGSFTESGYVVRHDAFMPQQSRDYVVFTLHLASSTDSMVLRLPAEEETLDAALDQLGITEFAQAQIRKAEINLPYLEGSIPLECVCVAIANDLALSIESLNQRDGELLKYLSVLAVEQPETMADALFYANELDDYERVPADTEEYGKQVLLRMGANRDVMQALEGNTNFSAIGEFYMTEDGVRQTEFGLVRRCGEPFPEEAPGMMMGGM